MILRRGRLSLALVPLLSIVAMLAPGAPAASAVSLDNVTGGQSVLYVPFSNVATLAQNHMVAFPIGGAWLSYTNIPALNFPISGGTVESSTMLGTVNHPGGIAIEKFNPDGSVAKRLDVTNLKIVNGITLAGNALDLVPAPTADLINASHSKDPSSGVITFNADAQMNAVTTTVLNTYFSTDAFKAGMILGHLTSKIQTKQLL